MDEEMNIEPQAVRRGPGRPPRIPREDMRDEPRADLRQEARSDLRFEPRAPRRGNRHMLDDFYVPPELIPAGRSLNWKAETVAGQPQDSQMHAYYEDGWRPMNSESMPGYMPKDHKGPIRRKGMVLMERPIEFTQEAEREAYKVARAQFNGAKRATNLKVSGDGYSTDHRELPNKASVGYERLPSQDEMEIPE